MNNIQETGKKQTPQERHLKAMAKKAKQRRPLRGAARRITRDSYRTLWKQYCFGLASNVIWPSLAEWIRTEQGDDNVA